MRNLRLHPKAVARQLLTRLEDQPQLSANDEVRILDALKNSGVPNATDRLLAHLSKNVVKELLIEL
jgi:hypothetical protein